MDGWLVGWMYGWMQAYEDHAKITGTHVVLALHVPCLRSIQIITYHTSCLQVHDISMPRSSSYPLSNLLLTVRR
jgi:hypothetical protein